MKKIVLGSSSPYRKAILKKLVPDFDCLSPNIDEKQLVSETPSQMVARLARLKSEEVARMVDAECIIITSDQVAYCNNCVLGKPIDAKDAVEQLLSFSGNDVLFFTSLCVVDLATNQYREAVKTVSVSFRELSRKEAERYVEIESPLNCAGSFKSEGLGISMFSKIESDDPNTLIGLPLIQLNQFLIELGIHPLLTFNYK